MLFFSPAGVFIGWKDTVEGAAMWDYIEEYSAGTDFCLLDLFNGIGDLASNVMVALLWTTFDAQ